MTDKATLTFICDNLLSEESLGEGAEFLRSARKNRMSDKDIIYTATLHVLETLGITTAHEVCHFNDTGEILDKDTDVRISS